MKNFKLYSIVFFAIISFSQVNAQQLGVRGGVNFATASTDADLALDAVTGWQLGMTFEIPLIANLNLDANLMYARRGYRRSTDAVTSNTRVDYLDIPIDLVYKIPLGAGITNLFVSAGPYISLGLYSSYDDGNGNITNEFNTADADLKKIDSGINLGGGAQFGNFRLGGYYGLGLTDINKLDSETLTNRSLKVTGHYFF